MPTQRRGIGRPPALARHQEARCVEVLRDPHLSLSQCLRLLQREIPQLTRSTLFRINERDRRNHPDIARPRRTDSIDANKNLNSHERSGNQQADKCGRPRKITDEERNVVRALVKDAGSIRAAQYEILERYPALRQRNDKKTTDAIRYYAKAESLEQHATTSMVERSAFMQACYAQGFNSSDLVNKLDAVIAQGGVNHQSARQLLTAIKSYSSRAFALRSLQAALRRLVERGVLDYAPSPQGRLYTFPSRRGSAVRSLLRNEASDGAVLRSAEAEVQPKLQS